jgi:hypothetical protein
MRPLARAKDRRMKQLAFSKFVSRTKMLQRMEKQLKIAFRVR